MREVERPIAVFDSGLGGISVLRALVRLMPQENYLYFGDSLHAPYGTRPTQEIRDLSFAAAQALFAQGVKALVVACNTATSAAVDELRAAYPVWLAEYDVEAPTAPLDFAIWQYTNAGTVPGIPTDVDLNVWLEPQK